MAITATQRNDVISLLVGMFDAAPSAELLTGFVASIEAGKTVAELANELAVTSEFESLYPTWLTNDEFAERFATNILDGNTDAATLTAGVDFVKSALNGGASRGDAANTVVSALMAVDVTDATWGAAAQGLMNKVDVATYFATTKLNADSSFDALRSVVADVNADADSVSNQKVLIDAGLDSAAQNLTVDQDSLTGSAGNDAFTAWIFNNSNTAQSGDSINGGAGTDTLMAEIGNSQDFAISLKTESVEVAHFRAQTTSTDSSDNDVDAAGDSIDNNTQIDAGDMNGTVEFWSTDSRANLTIEDVQTDSHETTIGWRNSDSGPLNYEVYFDNITAPGSSSANSQLFLELLDLDGMRTDGEPLKDNPYVGLQFKIGTETVTVAAETPVQTTFADLVAGINALLQDNPLSVNVTASLGSAFSAINSKDGKSYGGTTIVLTNSGPETLVGEGWVVDGVLPPDSNVHTQIEDTPPETDTNLTQTDVIFDYVGSGSKSGTFIAGEISQQGGSTSGTPGIQQFNLSVDRDSWAQEIRSTEETLEEVFVKSIGSKGTLRIDHLEDVKIFDASAMENSVTLTADLDADVIAKYLTPKDEASALPESDNDVFNYLFSNADDKLTLTVSEEASAREDFELNVTMGGGDDTLTVSLSNNTVGLNSNWYADQHTLKGITLSAGDGNDTITASGSGDTTIIAGNGNDTVYADNSGTALYDTDGDTAVDDASMATWVFNADANAGDDDISDLAGAPLVKSWLHDATVVVTFSAATTNGSGVTDGTAVENDNGYESTAIEIPLTDYMGTQANVNQAIKAAINSDPVLSKLLMAADGPDNTLIVTSLIDGEFAADDLVVDIKAATWANYSASEMTALQTAWDLINKDSDVAPLDQAALNAAVTATEGAATTGYAAAVLADDAAGTQIVGAASATVSDNTIKLGNGNDVAVLGTDAVAANAGGVGVLTVAEDLANSNDTLVFEAGVIGNNTIVNFIDGSDATTDAGVDFLDFTDILDTIVNTSASNSAASKAEANITFDGDTSNEVNEVSALTGAPGAAGAFVANVTETWAGLTAAELLDAINGDGDFGSIVDGSAASDNGAARFGTDDTDVVGGSQDHLLMVENAANHGEYKVFKLTSVSDADANVDTGDFATAELVGTIDFGDTVAFDTGLLV